MITLNEVHALGSRMKIEIAYPPNIDAIDKVFKGVKRSCTTRGIFFAWGYTIYNPSGHAIPLELIAHEAVHAAQTEEVNGPERWWQQYLEDVEQRFQWELEAHRIEYQEYVRLFPARAERRRYIALCAERLSGELYGRLVKKDQAKKLILTEDDYDRSIISRPKRAQEHTAL
jgi:hypothetical protein